MKKFVNKLIKSSFSLSKERKFNIIISLFFICNTMQVILSFKCSLSPSKIISNCLYFKSRETIKKMINDFRVSCDLNRIRDYINEHFSHYSCYGNKYDINDLFFFCRHTLIET